MRTRYQVTRLPTGLAVATASMPDRPSVSLGIWIGVGGRYEPAPLNGACHFIEHMVFKGTCRRSAHEISQAVEGIGGYLNAFTGEETTCLYSRARHDHTDSLLEVLADMLLHSRFTSADVDKERNVIKEELAMYLDQPQQHVQELLNATLWPDQPLGRPLTGTAQSLDGIGRRELLDFLRSHYTAPSVCVAAAGHVQHAQLVRNVSRALRQLPKTPRPQATPAAEHQSRPQVRLCTKSIEQTQLALALRTCSRHDDRRFALRLLNTILGENMSSRLFQVVREDRGLAYHIGTALSYFDDAGILVLSAGLDPENLSQTIPLVLRELRRLAERPPTSAEFRRARDYVLGQMDLSLESTENQMHWVGEQILGYGRLPRPEAIRRRISAVTLAEITAVARAFFRPDRLSLALVSPLKSDRAVRRLLRAF